MEKCAPTNTLSVGARRRANRFTCKPKNRSHRNGVLCTRREEGSRSIGVGQRGRRKSSAEWFIAYLTDTAERTKNLSYKYCLLFAYILCPVRRPSIHPFVCCVGYSTFPSALQSSTRRDVGTDWISKILARCAIVNFASSTFFFSRSVCECGREGRGGGIQRGGAFVGEGDVFDCLPH